MVWAVGEDGVWRGVGGSKEPEEESCKVLVSASADGVVAALDWVDWSGVGVPCRGNPGGLM
jgi:hypothetical protein